MKMKWKTVENVANISELCGTDHYVQNRVLVTADIMKFCDTFSIWTSETDAKA